MVAVLFMIGQGFESPDVRKPVLITDWFSDFCGLNFLQSEALFENIILPPF